MGENQKLHCTFAHEIAFRETGFTYIAGVDEAGRGPLAGPVVAAAAILPGDWFDKSLKGKKKEPWKLINDSKQLSAETREELFAIVTASAVTYGVGIVSSEEIDKIGIVPSTLKAMTIAISQLTPQPQALLIDYVDLSHLGFPSKSMIDGDALCKSVAAASIIAKVTRDRLMREMDEVHPGYGFAQHKGYATEHHMQQLQALGPCAIHRKSFAPIYQMLIQPRLL